MALKGVYTDKKKNDRPNYRAGITVTGKHISLGSYTSEKKAHEAYLFAGQLLKDRSLTIQDYKSSCPLIFEKYVTLINLRDNNIYFATPIYLYKRDFGYFLSPVRELKFDMDDLFYFSQHKIMERGNHLFISEYGMQTSLRDRFGIMSFAVEGRDFLFINKDDLDYRRENLEIINRYHGVRLIKTLRKTVYKAVIHLRSDYVVGNYLTEKEAAIAYNKAADILIKNGFSKNFMQNYLEDVSPREYAMIYTDVKISEKIEKLTPQTT
ncbi:MAG: hypothetical protein K6E32_00460 [Lachnospiraceae bacterium]|nr:hypothetical protein [Lachnospiraceae bacterium]